MFWEYFARILPDMADLLLVFVHGYSVTNLDTYGGLPQRLLNEAAQRGISARSENIFLGRYISFNDEVRLDDVSRALETAVKEQIPAGTPFVCITHSTGGPVVRNWWHLFYRNKTNVCPMSHLIMLAPANHGSSLAQLGKGRLSRVKSWFDGVEPGQNILNWLELGSQDSWDLTLDWIRHGETYLQTQGFFPFVITGQDIDRKLYDHINSYTGESGSDGVVRVASANLNSRYLKLEQKKATTGEDSLVQLNVSEFLRAPLTATRIVSGKSHSGDSMGILKSVKPSLDDQASRETVDTIFRCIAIHDVAAYRELALRFEEESRAVQEAGRIEIDKKLLRKSVYIHDRYCMLIFRIRDSEGLPVPNFDLLLGAGPETDPDLLPRGFFVDRQCNQRDNSVLTYYLNYDLLTGTAALVKDGEVIRAAEEGIQTLGLILRPRPDTGFVRYAPCSISASEDLLTQVLQANGTTLVDICLQRLVSKEVFRFEATDPVKLANKDFKKTHPGSETV